MDGSVNAEQVPPPNGRTGALAFGAAGSALSELAGLMLSTGSTEELLQGVVDLAITAVSGAATGGVTLGEDGRARTAAASDALASELDELQYAMDFGPCLDALRIGEVVSAPDLAAETRWDGYPAEAMARGVHAVLSTPLLVEDKPAGVLNLYGRTPGCFEGDLELTHLFAGLAATTLTAAMRRRDELALTENLRSALSSRAVIDQALGIVMAQRRCSSDDAFAMLRALSQRRNVKLRAVAAEIVAAVQRRP